MAILKMRRVASVLIALALAATGNANTGYSTTLDASGAMLIQSLTANPDFDRAMNQDAKLLTAFANDPHLAHSPKAYRHILRDQISLQFLFGEPSGVSEGYTIGEHTTRVLDIFHEQKLAYAMDKIPPPSGVTDLNRLMTFTLAFHDIGKSIAFRGGDKSRETVYSVPLARDLLAAAGFNEAEIRIGTSLIESHQLIGSFLVNQISLMDVAAAIREGAARAGIDTKIYFALLQIVFVADAASYPLLHSNVFERRGQRLTPKDPDYQNLQKLFN